ncbi:hypothetical protein APR03_003231 [Promicromonospora thailandica]|uniref:Uncharacterized protein n=1 Tax=Promicromonospora thailandica TaxID=765201 RepID=A0A9X2GC97_9MICO|nr:hypothetical protein [Promicromonospora thailandica]BFF21573.1 hypothetical protein GCM10025730_50940 [Promicromonospora thailandica]
MRCVWMFEKCISMRWAGKNTTTTGAEVLVETGWAFTDAHGQRIRLPHTIDPRTDDPHDDDRPLPDAASGGKDRAGQADRPGQALPSRLPRSPGHAPGWNAPTSSSSWSALAHAVSVSSSFCTNSERVSPGA